MSRTWRRLPKKSLLHRSRPRNQGGAHASAGPSPERRRPGSDHDTENLHHAVAVLNRAAAQLAGQPASTSADQALWLTAFHGDLPAGRLLPVLYIAQEVLGQAGDNSGTDTPETLRQAAATLETIANARGARETPHYRNYLVPDGRQLDSSIPFWRDNRVTGLRAADYRRARREAKMGLVDDESAETVRAGKGRRYVDQYGRYDL